MQNDERFLAIKLQCLQLAHSGSPETTIQVAEKYFDWLVPKIEVTDPLPKRGRPPKLKL
jgi:hypothetical protein